MTSLDAGVLSRLQPAGVGVSVVYGYVCACYRGWGRGREGRDMVSVSVGGVERLEGVEMEGGSST